MDTSSPQSAPSAQFTVNSSQSALSSLPAISRLAEAVAQNQPGLATTEFYVAAGALISLYILTLLGDLPSAWAGVATLLMPGLYQFLRNQRKDDREGSLLSLIDTLKDAAPLSLNTPPSISGPKAADVSGPTVAQPSPAEEAAPSGAASGQAGQPVVPTQPVRTTINGLVAPAESGLPGTGAGVGPQTSFREIHTSADGGTVIEVLGFIAAGAAAGLLAISLYGCNTAQQAAIDKFNSSPAVKAVGARLGQDAAVAANAAATAAASETLSQLQTGGKVDSKAIGESAGAAAVTSLIQLDVQRATQPKATPAPAPSGKAVIPPQTSTSAPLRPLRLTAFFNGGVEVFIPCRDLEPRLPRPSPRFRWHVPAIEFPPTLNLNVFDLPVAEAAAHGTSGGRSTGEI